MTPNTPTPGEPWLYWEDFREGQVLEFGAVEDKRDDIVRFAAEFDPQRFHLDEDAARDSLFGGLVASGWHTASMSMRMMWEGYLHRAESLGSPGIESLKWLLPVRPGDTLRMRLTVLESRPLKSRPGIGLVKSRHQVLNERDEVVMEMDGYGMFGRRPQG